MALVVNSNLSSLNALNNLNRTNRSLSSTMGRISSGLRINKAADDGAGLGVAENLDASVRSLQVAKRNANDGIAVIQVAESATNEVSHVLKRMRELAVQSSSETLESTERAYVQAEYTELRSEISRISSVTEFNGIGLTRGTANNAGGKAGVTGLDVQIGMYNTTDDRIDVGLGDLSLGVSGLNLTGGVGDVSLGSASSAQLALDRLDSALNTVNNYRSTYGAVQNRLDSSIRSLDSYTENLSAAESQIRDADFAHEAAEMAKSQIMQQAGTAILSQANQINQGALRLIG
jgi:flagellin